MNDLFVINGNRLDETQIDAIKSKAKSTLVVAGAGAGKTLTIMGKIKYLISIEGLKEEEILCISFTNETVKSLYEKLLKQGYDIEVKTFHKLGLKLLDNDNISIINDNYLDFIIDEYFKSFIRFNKKRLRSLKNVLYTNLSISEILRTQEYKNLKKLISTFIKLAKCNNYSIKDIFYIYKKTFFREKDIIHNILDIYMIYENELKSLNKIDFDDMIIKAIEKVKDANLPYKFIIIDEFQDTSQVRYDLINEIIKYTSSRVFVVGDDWQSIYRFSGCNLNLFVNFKNFFDDSKYYYLKYTYRNSNELIHVSSQFIMKNKKQLIKNIESHINLDKPIVVTFNYSIDDITNLIGNERILVLGRNNADIDNVDWENKLTIHRSKGLEEDNVILVNSDSIPSKVPNERLLRFVLNDNDYILYEEERRLFYVALTRTREKIYIMVNKSVSPFVKELMRDYKDYIQVLKK